MRRACPSTSGAQPNTSPRRMMSSAGDIIRRGDVFGWAPLVEGHARRIATAYCLTACAVVAIDGAALNRLMEGDPGLGYALMKKLAVLLTSELVAFAAG